MLIAHSHEKHTPTHALICSAIHGVKKKRAQHTHRLQCRQHAVTQSGNQNTFIKYQEHSTQVDKKNYTT